jgi:hypothetical protein
MRQSQDIAGKVTKHARISLACFALGKQWLRADYLCPLARRNTLSKKVSLYQTDASCSIPKKLKTFLALPIGRNLLTF